MKDIGLYQQILSISFPCKVNHPRLQVRVVYFASDAVGQMLSAADPSASYSFQYDGLGHAASVEHGITGLEPAVTFAAEHDAAFERPEPCGDPLSPQVPLRVPGSRSVGLVPAWRDRHR